MERLFTRLYAGIAVCGLIVLALSFAPWVKFHSVSVPGDTSPAISYNLAGTHTSRWRDLDQLDRNTPEEDNWCSCYVSAGDGWITAGLGILLVLVAGFGWWVQHDRAASVAGGIVALVALGLSGFDAIADWQAIIYTNLQRLEALDGTIQIGLIGVVLASALAAVLSGLALGFAWLYDRPADEEEMMIADEQSMDGGESWA